MYVIKLKTIFTTKQYCVHLLGVLFVVMSIIRDHWFWLTLKDIPRDTETIMKLKRP